MRFLIESTCEVFQVPLSSIFHDAFYPHPAFSSSPNHLEQHISIVSESLLPLDIFLFVREYQSSPA
jgi:hypothetical protein